MGTGDTPEISNCFVCSIPVPAKTIPTGEVKRIFEKRVGFEREDQDAVVGRFQISGIKSGERAK